MNYAYSPFNRFQVYEFENFQVKFDYVEKVLKVLRYVLQRV